MAATALLIAEVNVNTLCALEKNSVSIKSMAGETIGNVGAGISSAAYAFIHYALLIAYMLEGGKLLVELVPALGALGAPDAAAFCVLGGGALLLGSARVVDRANSALFAGVIGTFALLACLGAQSISPAYLAHSAPAATLPALPVMVLSFTFHNIVPTICYQLGCDLDRIRVAILGGSAIPLVMFLLWNGVVLGSVPYDAGLGAVRGTFDPLETLRAGGDAFGTVVSAFSLLAIATSFIGFCLGLVDFYADLLNLNGAGSDGEGPSITAGTQPEAQRTLTAAPALSDDVEEPYADDATGAAARPLSVKAGLYALVLLPPLGVATVDPSLFFAALDNAGTFGILTLFGIVPCLMAWSMRYGSDTEPPVVPPAVPGGRVSLVFMGGAPLW